MFPARLILLTRETKADLRFNALLLELLKIIVRSAIHFDMNVQYGQAFGLQKDFEVYFLVQLS